AFGAELELRLAAEIQILRMASNSLRPRLAASERLKPGLRDFAKEILAPQRAAHRDAVDLDEPPFLFRLANFEGAKVQHRVFRVAVGHPHGWLGFRLVEPRHGV